MIDDIQNIRVERINKIISLCKEEQEYWGKRRIEFKTKLEEQKYI